MAPKLYWIEAPGPGRLAIFSRPRGGDWLADEMLALKAAGVDTLLSLLTPQEERELELTSETNEANLAGLNFVSFPIPDRQVPSSASELSPVLENLNEVLTSGKNAAIHCRQGVGRSGLVAACLLILRGVELGSALQAIQKAREVSVPETAEQKQWIETFASGLAHAR